MEGNAVAIGLDLAWSRGKSTGACAVGIDGTIVDEALLGPDDDIVAWVDRHAGGRCAVAIDAPIRVPNETGRRVCEREVASAYGGRHAGPHPSNRGLHMRNFGVIRGEEIAAALGRLGFGGPWDGSDRTVLEVFPHPAIVEAFGLDRRLAYKRGRLAERRSGLRRLAVLVATLAEADPPLVGGRVRIDDDMTGRQLKDLEDRLDARICAWVALSWVHHGTNRIRLFGDAERGHIAVPIGRADGTAPR
jgi:predicted RNase H-like nuclease